MIQGKLGSLVGRSSGYVESLPPQVKRRVAGLKGIQKEHSKLEAEFQEEVLQLEKKFFAKFTPLYEKRSKIVNGTQEPTDEEIVAGEDSDEEEEEDKADAKTEVGDASAETVSGIPEFWLSAMKNQISLAEMITDRDEGALKHLTDIRMEYLDKPGFRLIFEFAENDYFTNKTISKTYFYQSESGYGGDFIYDHAEGDKINWKADKDLTVRIEQKKQRNKSKLMVAAQVVKRHANLTVLDTKQTRIVKKTVPTESFFNFFSPPEPPSEENEEAAFDIEDRLELDYQLGEDIKEKLIPRAIDWFTGEALAYEEIDEDDINEDFDDDEDDEDDLSEDHDEDDDSEDDDVSFWTIYKGQIGSVANLHFFSRMTAQSRNPTPKSASKAKRVAQRCF